MAGVRKVVFAGEPGRLGAREIDTGGIAIARRYPNPDR
jgi:hypothetical protein